VNFTCRKSASLIVLTLALMPLPQAFGQDLEPRRWTPLPPGLNVVGAGYVRTEGDISFDPVLLIEDAEVGGHTAAISYVRSFAIAGKLARLDLVVPWQNLHWTGLLDGVPAEAKRVGLADPNIRLSMILAGGPPDPSASSNTVVGAAVAVSVPLGEYFEDKLLNLGQNRVIIRPQIGVLHTRGKWSYELTGSTFLYGDNDDFYDGSTLEQDPLYALQGHVIRTFNKPGYWAALSAGYGWNGRSTVDGVRSDNSKRLFLSALAVGMPIGKSQGVKFAYIRSRTNTNKGSDTDSLAIALSHRF
jgi:hypothetical protein